MNTQSSDIATTTNLHQHDENESSSDDSDFSNYFNKTIALKRITAPPTSDSESDEQASDNNANTRQHNDGNVPPNGSDLNRS